jgi:LysR family transcriptional regulator, nitrogen assimilation regulatory protein
MDLKQLKHLILVAELGSFSRAAAVLNMAQPSLSRQIGNLEEVLGRKLLIRNGRGAAPTEAGERLIRHARRIVELMAEAEADVRAAGAGRFAIGIPFTIAATIASDLVHRLRLAEPNVNLAVIQGRSALLLEGLWSGTIDAAIIFKPPPSPLVETTTLMTEELFLMAPAKAARSVVKKAPIPLESVCDFPLIVPGRPNAIRRILEEALAQAKKTPVFAMEIDNVETILDLVGQGEGFSVLSNLSRSLSAHAERVVPIPLAPPGLRSEICLAVSTRGSLTPAKRELVKLAGDLSRDLLREAARRRPNGVKRRRGSVLQD